MTPNHSQGDPETTCADASGKCIAIVLRNILYLRNFERPIRQLADSGHRIHLLIGPRVLGELPETKAQLDRLLADFNGQVLVQRYPPRQDHHRYFASELQSATDILFWSGEHIDQTPHLRDRIVQKAQPFARTLFSGKSFLNEATAQKTLSRLRKLSDSLPVDPEVARILRSVAPDLLIISPLIDIGSEQNQWLRAARELRIPSILAVASWDNLTNKSRIQTIPDLVIVWNDIQRQEAFDLHDIPVERISITGAQLYDQWFDRTPLRTYEDLCGAFEFDPAESMLLYAGSSKSIAPNETEFVRKWIQSIRDSDHPEINNANILIRPHPLNQPPFANVDFSEFERIAVHPKANGFPVTEEGRAGYFDALFHCSAIVGINTSVIVEAAILGKTSFTIETQSNKGGQSGTKHFHHLTDGGILKRSQNFAQHAEQLALFIGNRDSSSKTVEKFVKSFIRPHGLDLPATRFFVEAVEKTLSNETPSIDLSLAKPPLYLRATSQIMSLLVFFGRHAIAQPIKRFVRPKP